MFETPILFLLFNRPNSTTQVFEQIRKRRPKYLYVAADGPRHGRSDDEQFCRESRDLVLNNIDWQCEVKTLLRKNNLGCRKAVSEAITWFFEQVEQGIVLEDDCLPDPSFFIYCEQLLEKYKSNENVFSIGGTNMGDDLTTDSSYGYSRFMNMWGWASWRRSMLLVDYDMKPWHKILHKNWFLYNRIKNSSGIDINFIAYWKNYFDNTASGEIDTWDYQWIFIQMLSKKLSIFPRKNLIKNIGFNGLATHTNDTNHPVSNLHLQSLPFPLIHPSKMQFDEHYEEEYLKKVWLNNRKESVVTILKTKLLYIPFVNRINKLIKRSS